MKKIKYLHNAAELAAAFRYDPQTGILYRRLISGDEQPCVCSSSTGHMRVKFFGREIGVHRIAWTLHHGEFPTVEIDHINGDPTDNRICNLRLATASQNAQNRRLPAHNTTGAKNVCRVKWRKKFKWRVTIGLGNRKNYEAHFYCLGHAIKHAQEMRLSLYGEFARSS